MLEKPQQLKTAGIVQIVSGILNIVIFSWMSAFILSSVGYTATCLTSTFISTLLLAVGCPLGIITFFFSYCGCLCGGWGMLLLPIGVFEIIAGVMASSKPDGAPAIVKYAAITELVSILFGGLG